MMLTASNSQYPASQSCLKCAAFTLDPLPIPDDSYDVPRMPRWGLCANDQKKANVKFWCEAYKADLIAYGTACEMEV